MTDLFLYETKNLQYVTMGWQMVSENTFLKTLERFLQPFSPDFLSSPLVLHTLFQMQLTALQETPQLSQGKEILAIRWTYF